MISADDLYQLLPVVQRVRDEEQFGPLRALIEILAEEAALVDRDISGLYDNWFIETCEPWVVPYIGDLLGVRGLYAVAPGTTSQRAYVANTLGYRRRKGTVAVLEQLAFDVTGWRAKVVEFFQLLGTTQYVKHLRPHNLRTPDLRDANALELLGGPFEQATRTAEIRRVPPRRGRYNIPNVGLYVWRLQSYPISRGTGRSVTTPPDGRYTFSPIGLDVPLFNQERTDTGIGDLAREPDVPGRLRRRALRASPADYLTDRKVVRVHVRDTPTDAFEEVEPGELLVADLGLWQRPPAPAPGARALAIDPERGRLAFPDGETPDRVEVSYAYGFAGDVGGGPYDRTRNARADFVERVGWQVAVGQAATPVAGQVVRTLGEAVRLWNQQDPGVVGVISILDSRTYEEDLADATQHRIELKTGSELLVVAADWPSPRVAGRFVAQGRRPHVLGAIEIVGTAPARSPAPGSLTLDGLLVEGRLEVAAGNLGGLELRHCALVPGAGGVVVGARNASLRLELLRTIAGRLKLPESAPSVRITDSVVDTASSGGTAIDAAGAAAEVERSTILGKTAVRTLEASNSIFTGEVVVSRRQVGCVRFSFVPDLAGTRTPRRFRCQPDLALKGVKGAPQQASVRASVAPSFTSLAYGQPGYAQLGRACPAEIATGDEDGSEMGVFSFLRQPQREANLSAALDEYLRFGLEAGVFHVT